SRLARAARRGAAYGRSPSRHGGGWPYLLHVPRQSRAEAAARAEQPAPRLRRAQEPLHLGPAGRPAVHEPALAGRSPPRRAGPLRPEEARGVRARGRRRSLHLAHRRPGRRPRRRHRGVLDGGRPMKPLNPVVAEVTARIVERSRETRADYLRRMDAAGSDKPGRAKLSCANWAHAFAGQPVVDKLTVMSGTQPNVGIVTAYNDMLSAHVPFERFPPIIREAAREMGATAQVAGATPAMCDGVTQGRPGMELSLFSRDVIALSTGVALTHDAFDAAICLGVCDKIVPGLFMGSLAF